MLERYDLKNRIQRGTGFSHLTEDARKQAQFIIAVTSDRKELPFIHHRLLEPFFCQSNDVVVAFQEKGQKNETGIYKELVQIPITGVLPAGHPLAEKELLDEDDLRTQRLLLLDPQRCPDNLNTVQHELTTGRAVSELLMCGSADACITLAKAGFGIAIQPDFPSLRDPALAYIPIESAEPLSYGAYYKSVTGKPLLKAFLQLCKEYFSG